jgi:hypothetical protein
MVRRLRHQLGLTATTLPSNLANLYVTIFPEDRKLNFEAHNAGADVSMACRLTIAYLRRALGTHLPGKLDSSLSQTGVKSGQGGWKLCDEEANDFLTRLHEAGVSNDQTFEAMNDGEEEEEEIDMCFHETFGDIEDEEFRDSNEDGGDVDNHVYNLGG